MSDISCKGPRAKRVWALDADLAAAFDRIDQTRLLEAIGDFPDKGMIAGWLRAGVFEKGKGFAPTAEGTPQGGVISPLLMNVALHGMEEAAGVRYIATGVRAGDIKPGSPTLIRYADDLVVLCHSQEQAGHVRAQLGGSGGVAGAQGSCLQRGQDADRAPVPGVRFPWV